MAVRLKEPLQRFLEEVMPVTIGTRRSDGSVQLNPVWYEFRDGSVWLNSAVGRGWPTHLQQQKEVTLLFVDPKNMYRWVQMQGQLVEATTEGADAHISRLSARYTGNPNYQKMRAEEQRIRFKIEPRRVNGWASRREPWQ